MYYTMGAYASGYLYKLKILKIKHLADIYASHDKTIFGNTSSDYTNASSALTFEKKKIMKLKEPK